MTRAAGEGSVVLVATPRNWFFEALAANLDGVGFSLRQAGNAKALIEAIHEDVPDLVLMHDELPGAPIAELCRRLRSEGLPPHVPLVAVTSSSHGRPDPEAAILEAGAWSVLREPIDPLLIALRLERLLEVGRLIRAGRDADGVDDATGVYSLAGLLRALDSLEALADRQGAPLTCAVLGPTHRGEGEVLERQRANTAEMCRTHVRRSDVCGWLGPGELVVVAFDTPVEGARELVLRLNAIASERAQIEESSSPALSAGIAELFPHGEEGTGISPGPEAPDQLEELGTLAAAREALERARRAGGGIERAAVA